MDGSIKLSAEEIAEMRTDAGSAERRAAFGAARRASESGTLDDYIDFLSQNMASVPPQPPRVHVTKDYRL
jgi:hypothetical protein